MAEGGVDVGRGRLAPVQRRLAAVEGEVLLAVEQVEAGAGHARHAREVADGGCVHVDAAQAAEVGFQ